MIDNEILSIKIEDELKQSYLDYAMSVIVGRALPDVHDGLKPVHRRVLFAMNELSNHWNKPYKKSARVVGDVIGKYHPHGDSAVYDTIVRMAQPFSLRYMLVDGQGNFGSVDGDSAAAMRYTEIRMRKISQDIMADLDKETVDYVPNYDGTEQIPAVMPTRIPNLLVNGAAGIAVGMATNIPPHNLTEIVRGCLALIDDCELSVDNLMEYIPGPDFPTAGIIQGRSGILQAYRTGRGRIYIRARADIDHDEKRNKSTIIITELPYQLNKVRLIEKIAELVKNKKITGIHELRDESDKDGMRIVIELRRGEVADVVLNNLYAHTPLESVFGINNVALVDGQPKLLNLKEMLEAFIRHRREVVTRKTVYELRKNIERGHLLEGLSIALSNIDPVIALIKASPTSIAAKEKLIAKSWNPKYVIEMTERAGTTPCRPDGLPEEYGLRDRKYYLSPAQAVAILDMRLHRLTDLEHDKLLSEYCALIERIAELMLVLSSSKRLMGIICEELKNVVKEYGDERRTKISTSRQDLMIEDLITEEDMLVTLSHGGYAKTTTLSTYQTQRRGGRGKAAISVKDEDYVEHILVANTHTQILCFSSKGKVYWLKVYQIPPAGRASRGRPIVNILPLAEEERITAMLPVSEYKANHYIFMATVAGTVKKTPLKKFRYPRSSGLIALSLNDGDALIGAKITTGEKRIILLSNAGKAICFEETDVRAMGRTAHGVRGMKLQEGQKVISLIIPEDKSQILTVSKNGFGKRTIVTDFRVTGRGGQGVIAMKSTDRNGALMSSIQVKDDDEVMLISDQGTLVRIKVDEISVMSRNTQGVTLIKIQKGEQLTDVGCVEKLEQPMKKN